MPIDPAYLNMDGSAAIITIDEELIRNAIAFCAPQSLLGWINLYIALLIIMIIILAVLYSRMRRAQQDSTDLEIPGLDPDLAKHPVE